MSAPDSSPERMPGCVVLRSRLGPRPVWRLFRDPVQIIQTRRVEEVAACLADVQRAADQGLYAAGFVAYEAAPAFDPAYCVRPGSGDPLLWFGLYSEAQETTAPKNPAGPLDLSWQPTMAYPAYADAIDRIKAYIAAGESYQVNYTMQLEAPCAAAPWSVFRALLPAQPGGYAAYINAGDMALCSLSPELFFEWRRGRVRMRPMKGTVRRGLTTEQDRQRAEWLRRSEKNRAENVMIVDMVRNDLGRIARRGSVRVTDLFHIERYRTLFQMTTAIEAQTDASLGDLFGALFPCASITGAPKIRTMEIIAELERLPRGLYTGAIGFVTPHREAQFNVAIRTVRIDRRRAVASFGTGGGIVWDSNPVEEYRECATKALVLREPPPALELLETLRWEPAEGYLLLQEHLDRLLDSAQYFDFPAAEEEVRAVLTSAVGDVSNQARRIRLLLNDQGRPRIDAATPLDDPFEADPDRTRALWRVALAPGPVDRRDRFLYHKTTRREAYREARNARPQADDVLLWNERRELTESVWGNLVLRMGRRWQTPPIRCGLLAGTYRRRLLDLGRIEEAVLPLSALDQADGIYVINSVRGWIRAEILDRQES